MLVNLQFSFSPSAIPYAATKWSFERMLVTYRTTDGTSCSQDRVLQKQHRQYFVFQPSWASVAPSQNRTLPRMLVVLNSFCGDVKIVLQVNNHLVPSAFLRELARSIGKQSSSLCSIGLVDHHTCNS